MNIANTGVRFQFSNAFTAPAFSAKYTAQGTKRDADVQRLERAAEDAKRECRNGGLTPKTWQSYQAAYTRVHGRVDREKSNPD